MNIKNTINYFGMLYPKLIAKREFSKQTFKSINERPHELAFLFKHLAQEQPKKVLDVGTGMTSLPHLMRNCGFHVTAFDNIKDYWSVGMVNRHYHVINEDITTTEYPEKFDFISCISVLEHITNHHSAMSKMIGLLNPGGTLILSCPFNAGKYIPNVYSLPHSNTKEIFSFVTQSFSVIERNSWLSSNQVILIEDEYWKFFDGDYWTCGNKLVKPIQTSIDEPHQICCMAFKKK